MTVLGGIVGAIVGFGVGLLVTEVIIGNPPNQSGFDWIMVMDVVFTAIGALAGVSLARRLTSAKASRLGVR
jgi:ABC-type lipoprotein release transport system permease subunit